MKKGQRVTVNGVSGVVDAIIGGTAYVTLSEPVHMLSGIKGLFFEKVTRGMVEPMTDLLGYGTALALEDAGEKLPKGKWSKDGRTYKLSEPIDLEPLIAFCKKSHPEYKQCWLQSAWLSEVPLHND